MSGPSRRPRGRDRLPSRRAPSGPVPVVDLAAVASALAARVRPAPVATGGGLPSPAVAPAYLAPAAAADATGAVVAVDVLRAFTTAAFALAGGASGIVLAASVDEALAYKAAHPGVLAVGEDRGMRPDGFDLPNSPVLVSEADVAGREVVLRTSAGTRGALAARRAQRLWCASLVVATATARAVAAAGLGDPTYVLTGPGDDDRMAAEVIERARMGLAVASPDLASTEEARRTLALGDGHVHADDIAWASTVDAFDFAMEATWSQGCLRLHTG